MEQMFLEKRNISRRAIVGKDAVVSSGGYLDTTRGLVLTNESALGTARNKASQYREKKQTVKRNEVERKAAE